MSVPPLVDTRQSTRVNLMVMGLDIGPAGVRTWVSTEILPLGEMIVPAMMTGTVPVVAPDQIIFVLGDFRGDVWIRES